MVDVAKVSVSVHPLKTDPFCENSTGIVDSSLEDMPAPNVIPAPSVILAITIISLL
jgi:hypothetical protein